MYLFVELEPGLVVLGVGVLQPEEPDLPEADGFDDLLWFGGFRIGFESNYDKSFTKLSIALYPEIPDSIPS